MIKRIFSWLTGAAFGLALLLPPEGTAEPVLDGDLDVITDPRATRG